jgi:hypothetical protein
VHRWHGRHDGAARSGDAREPGEPAGRLTVVRYVDADSRPAIGNCAAVDVLAERRHDVAARALRDAA